MAIMHLITTTLLIITVYISIKRDDKRLKEYRKLKSLVTRQGIAICNLQYEIKKLEKDQDKKDQELVKLKSDVLQIKTFK